jgi:hypothetical protein
MCSSSENNFPIGIRIPDSRRVALERAAAMRGESVAVYIEGLIAEAGLIEQPKPVTGRRTRSGAR